MIDRVLEWFAMESSMTPNSELRLNNGYINRILLSVNYIKENVVSTFPELKSETFDKHFDFILYKLFKEEYIGFSVSISDGVDGYYPNLDGIIFSQSGGYAQVQRNLENDKLYRELIDYHSSQNAERLNYLTAFLVIGTLSLAVSEGIKIYVDKPEYFCQYVEISTCISLIVISVWLITRKAKPKLTNL